MRSRPAKDTDLKGPLFGALDGRSEMDVEIRRRLVQSATVRRWDAGSSVFFEDDPGDCVLVLLDGRAKVVLEPPEEHQDKQELILGFLHPFAVVGELGPLEGAARSAAVITIASSEFLRIPAGVFLDAMRAKPELAIEVVRHLSRIIRTVNERLRTVSMYDAHGQTVRGLFLFCQRRDSRGSELLLTGVPQVSELAQMLGRRRETVSNAISELVQGKYLVVTRRGQALNEVTVTRKAINTYLKGLYSPAQGNPG